MELEELLEDACPTPTDAVDDAVEL